MAVRINRAFTEHIMPGGDNVSKKQEAVLQAIYENAEMGRETIFHLRRKAKGSFSQLLKEQQASYDAILTRSSEMLREMGVTPRRPPWYQRMMTDMSMDMQTARNATPAHLSQMLIRGATMGVSDLKKELRLHPDVAQPIRALGEELLKIEQAQVRQWMNTL